MVCGRASGLNDKHIFAPDVLFDFDERLAVGEGGDSAFADLDPDIVANGLGQRRIGCAAKNLHDALNLPLPEK